MTLQDKLDDILLQLQTGTLYADNTEPAMTNNRGIAAQAILKAIREDVIGEDTHIKAPYTLLTLQKAYDNGANMLRAAQRKRLK